MRNYALDEISDRLLASLFIKMAEQSGRTRNDTVNKDFDATARSMVETTVYLRSFPDGENERIINVEICSIWATDIKLSWAKDVEYHPVDEKGEQNGDAYETPIEVENHERCKLIYDPDSKKITHVVGELDEVKSREFLLRLMEEGEWGMTWKELASARLGAEMDALMGDCNP